MTPLISRPKAEAANAIIAFLAALCISLSACTHNNGNIGPIFGSWALDSITEDGRPYPLGKDDATVFAFQDEIVRVTRLTNPPYAKDMKTGNFAIHGDELTLRFARNTGPDAGMFLTPYWLPLPDDGEPIHFRIDKLKGGAFVFSYDFNSHRYVFSCSRTW